VDARLVEVEEELLELTGFFKAVVRRSSSFPGDGGWRGRDVDADAGVHSPFPPPLSLALSLSLSLSVLPLLLPLSIC